MPGHCIRSLLHQVTYTQGLLSCWLACGRYVLDSVADNNQRYLVDGHIQAAPEVQALLE